MPPGAHLSDKRYNGEGSQGVDEEGVTCRVRDWRESKGGISVRVRLKARTGSEEGSGEE